jgi:hypothetical protein
MWMHMAYPEPRLMKHDESMLEQTMRIARLDHSNAIKLLPWVRGKR